MRHRAGRMRRNTALLAGLLLLLAGTVSTRAQMEVNWYRVYGGEREDYGKDIVETQDGSLALTGMTKSMGDIVGDMFLVHTNSNGVFEWGVTFGYGALEKGKELLQTADGGYVIAGYSFSRGFDPMERAAVVLKTDPAGEMIWGDLYGGTGNDSAFDIVPVAGGGFLAAGDYQLDSGVRNTYLIRLNEDGSTVWEQILGGDQVDDRTFSGCQLTNGNFVFAGWRRYDEISDPDFHVGSVDQDGNLLWEHEWGGGGVDVLRRVRALPTGGFVVTGEMDMYPDTEDENRDIYVAKFTAAGDSVWTTTVGTPGEEECNAFEVNSQGELMIVGSTQGSFHNSWDIYVTKLDTSGTLLYDYAFGSNNLEFGRGLTQKSSNSYVITGKTNYQVDLSGSLFLLKVTETDLLARTGRAVLPEVATQPLMRPDVVDGGAAVAPRTITLHPVTPNPTNAGALVGLTLPQSGFVHSAVYNSLGQQVIVLQNGVLSAGTHQFALMNSELASGVYFIRTEVPGQLNRVQRLTIVR